MLEREVKKYFEKRIKELGGEQRKLVWQNRVGAPDDLVLFPFGFHPLVELKRPKKGAEKRQLAEHEILRKAGFTVCVIDTKEKVDAFILQAKAVAALNLRCRDAIAAHSDLVRDGLRENSCDLDGITRSTFCRGH